MQMRDALFGVLFACLGLFMLVEASGFPSFPGQPYGASLLPSILGAGFILTGAILFLRDVLSGAGGTWIEPVAPLRTKSGAVAAALIVGTVLAHILFNTFFGFIPVSVICLTALMLWFRVPLLRAVVIAAGGTGLCWVLFAMLLKVPLSRGPLDWIL